MEQLNIESTKFTPEIKFHPDSNTLELKGRSYPENTAEFYEPVLMWLEDYVEAPDDVEISVNVELTYFNSSSSKVLMNIFDMLDEAAKKGKKVMVNWIFDEEDETIMEYGEEFLEDIEYLAFNLIAKDDGDDQ